MCLNEQQHLYNAFKVKTLACLLIVAALSSLKSTHHLNRSSYFISIVAYAQSHFMHQTKTGFNANKRRIICIYAHFTPVYRIICCSSISHSTTPFVPKMRSSIARYSIWEVENAGHSIKTHQRFWSFSVASLRCTDLSISILQ